VNALRRFRGPRGVLPLFLLFGLPLLLAGCKKPKESPVYVKPGPPFSAESAPGKAEVYVYWPRGEQGRNRQVFVGHCEGGEMLAILPNGYTAFAVEPGPQCFQADLSWDTWIDGGFAIETVAKVEIKAEPGHSSYIRIARKPGFFRSTYDLLRIEPDAAEPEIRRCRRTIPLDEQQVCWNR
jgi:hypothetical protein